MDPLTYNGTKVNTPPNENIAKANCSLFDTQRCEEVLRQVADIYEVVDTAYAKPCQSYRQFQTEPSSIQSDNITVKGCKKKIHGEDQSSIVKKRKLDGNPQENKKNANSQTENPGTIFRPSSQSKSIISPHLFETQNSNEILSSKNFNADKNIENILSSSSEYGEVRGLTQNILKDTNHICTPNRIMVASNSNATTPRPPSIMNVSNLSDSDMEITAINSFRNAQKEQTNLSQDDMVLDLELIELRDNANVVLAPLSPNNQEEKTVNYNNKCNVLQQQSVGGDFENNSDDKEFDSIQETISDLMTKPMSNIDFDYGGECIIFKNHGEETDSSDEDACNLNDKISCVEKNAVMPRNPLVLNQNVRPEKDLCSSPAHNFQVSSNLTTRTATKCQVTPTAIIMHKIQVSAEKSIILKQEKRKKGSTANRCLNDLFVKKNKEALQFQKENDCLRSQNEINCAPTCNKSLNFGINMINMFDMESGHCSNEIRNNALFKDNEFSVHQQPRSKKTNLAEEYENNKLHRRASIEGYSNSFRNDLFQIVNNYNAMINTHVDSVLRQGIKNICNRHSLHFIDISKAVIKKADENRLKLEEIRAGIGNLVRELEWQYDAFIKKSKEFDIHSEMCKLILDNVRTAEVPDFITQEYENIFKQIHSQQNITFQNVWHNFLKQQHKAKYD